VLFFLFVFSLSFVLAEGLVIPNQFYGFAKYNGAAASGMAVDAYVDGILVASTTALSDGRYGYGSMFLVGASDGNKTIVFYVNGVNSGQTAIFESGASTNLNLTATGSSSGGGNNNGGGGSSGGGGGGGGGRSNDDWSSVTILDEDAEDFNSSDTQVLNNDVLNIEGEGVESGFFSRVTGGVVGVVGSPGGIIVGIFVLLIVCGLVVLRVRKRE
jgi:hypothetical protein